MIDDIFRSTPIAHFHNARADDGSDGGGAWPAALDEILHPDVVRRALDEIRQWPGYAPTPLRSLDGLAGELGLGGIWYKDEAPRFGLGSFKALGGAYAVLNLLAEQLGADFADIRAGGLASAASAITVATATDGNHGRSVAWGAQQFGCHCVIYIHAEVSEGRKAAMEAFGAEVVRVDGNYDESVRRAAADAAANGWHIVSDTSYPGYTELPRHVMAGYTLMLDEVCAQLPAGTRLSHSIAQGGVGGLAGAVCGYFWQRFGAQRPRSLIVEPAFADCLYQSAMAGRATAVDIREETLMAGLSCGEVSYLGWQILSRGTHDFLSINDDTVAPSMRLLADGAGGAAPLVAGESAIAGLALLIAAMQRPELAAALGLDGASQVLLIGTEGATDAAIYQQLVGRPASAV